MRSLLLSIIGIVASALPGFCQLNVLHNRLRSGEVLIKQQVEYKDSGESGANRLWDFSKLKSVNDEYTLTMYYDYDAFGRLKRTFFYVGTIEKNIQNYDYHYQNQ